MYPGLQLRLFQLLLQHFFGPCRLEPPAGYGENHQENARILERVTSFQAQIMNHCLFLCIFDEYQQGGLSRLASREFIYSIYIYVFIPGVPSPKFGIGYSSHICWSCIDRGNDFWRISIRSHFSIGKSPLQTVEGCRPCNPGEKKHRGIL